MQYYKNTPRRVAEQSTPREVGSFPFCRSEPQARMQDISDPAMSCACRDTARLDRKHLQTEYPQSYARESLGVSASNECNGLAMVLVPHQEFENIYDVDEAFPRGTLFQSLDMPFYGDKRRGYK